MKEARDASKKTQTDIAEELGVTQPQIHKLESGEAVPVVHDIRRVAAVYGIDVDKFIAAVVSESEKIAKKREAKAS